MEDGTHAATTTLYVALSLSLLTIALTPLGAAREDPTRAIEDIGEQLPQTEPLPPWECFEDDDNASSVLCPPTPPGKGASCVSHGIVVMERDFTGVVGDATVTHSTSRADTGNTEGPPLVLNPFDGEPEEDPDAHADAQQAGISYTHTLSGLAIDGEVVHSRCDVAARLFDEGVGQFPNAAYGEAGAAELDVTLGGTPILSAGVLEQSFDAVGSESFTAAGQACEIVRLQTPGPQWTFCPGQNTGVNLGAANLVLNEVWGPISQDGRHTYGGAAAHLTIFGIGQIVDVYIGYTAVTVSGFDAQPPASI